MKVNKTDGTKTTHAALAAALKARDCYICPHLRSSNPALFGRRRSADDSQKAGELYWDLPLPSKAKRCSATYQDFGARHGRCLIWADCVAEDCGTRYGLRREEGYNDGSMWAIFEVDRDMVGGPTHPSWLAQLEPDNGGSSASCGKCSRQCCVDGITT